MRDKYPCDCEHEGIRNPTTQPISPSGPGPGQSGPVSTGAAATRARRPEVGGTGTRDRRSRSSCCGSRVGEGRVRGVCLPDVPRRRGVGRRRRRRSAAAARRGAGGRRHHVCGSLWQEVLLHLRRRAPTAVPSLPSLLLPPAGGQAVPPLPLAPRRRRLRRTPTGGARPPSTCPLPRHGSPGLPPPLTHFILPSPSHFPVLLVGPFLVVSR